MQYMSIWWRLTDPTNLCLGHMNVVDDRIVVEDVTPRTVCRVLVVVEHGLCKSQHGTKRDIRQFGTRTSPT